MKQIFDSMALNLAKAAAEASELSFTMRPTLARWRKHREAAKRVATLVDAQRRCAEAVNNASGFKVKNVKIIDYTAIWINCLKEKRKY